MHDWSITPKEAVDIQKRLTAQVRIEPLAALPARIGGCDVSMNRFAKEGFAGFTTLSYPALELLDHAVVENEIPFPYVPGLLSFREIPMLMQAWEKLQVKPDVLMVDGVGIAHPRRLGIASHLGLILDIPTIGCAKSVLTGSYEEPDWEPGHYTYLHDPRTKELLGAAVRTKRGAKPMFISPGHRITLRESIALTLACVRAYRLPEPTRLAHQTVNQYRIRASLKRNKSAVG